MAMPPEERAEAEALRNHVLVGAGIEGVRFWNMLVVLFSHQGAPSPGAYDEVFLRIESRGTVFPERPRTLPDSEDDLPTLGLDQQLVSLAGLNDQRVTRVALGSTHPHLVITFDSGRVLFVNGRHELYECWEFGTVTPQPQDKLSVVAWPGGIASWTGRAGPPS
jgi:hypothetical protein